MTHPDYLAHHGVQGMKWGVRNAETLRKYGLRGSGTGNAQKAPVKKGDRVAKAKKAVIRVGSGVKSAAVATGSGVKKVALATGSAVSGVKNARLAGKKKAAIKAVERGDMKTLKKNIKYLNAQELQGIQNRLSAEKALMSQVDAKTSKRGESAVLNALGKGARAAASDLAETAVKGVGRDVVSTFSNAFGSGAAEALTQVAMTRAAQKGGFDTQNMDMQANKVDYKSRFKEAARASLEKSQQERFKGTSAGRSYEKPWQNRVWKDLKSSQGK